MEPNSASRQSVYRILDANSNRASEGLRTLEEYFRLVSEDAKLTQSLKQLRHDLMTVISKWDRREMLKNRDVSGDVGCSIKTAAESSRESIESVVSAAVQRVQQSLRCLEEYGKFIDVSIAAELEKLRYRAYEVFADVELSTTRNVAWLTNARLYVLIDCQLPLREFLARASSLSQAGVDILQVRDKQRSAVDILEYSRQLLEELDPTRTRIVVNDRVDLASIVGCGVHLGQEDLPLVTARRFLPANRSIGISTHTIEQAMIAQSDGADHIGCGPTFPSQTKSFDAFPGLDFLIQVAEKISIPAFAIGGITFDRIDDVLSTGVHRVAVGHAIWNAKDSGDAAHRFAERLAGQAKDEIVSDDHIS